jgi:hypothetical protein
MDVPPRNAKKRAFAVFGVGSSVIATTQLTGVATATAAKTTGAAATTGTAAVAAKGATTGFALALFKGLAIGAVTGTVAYGSLTIRREHRQAMTAPTEHTSAQTFAPERRATQSATASEHTTAGTGATDSAPERKVADGLPSSEQVAPAIESKQPGEQGTPKLAPVTNERVARTVKSAPGHTLPEHVADVAADAPSALPHNQALVTKKPPSLRSERAAIEAAQALVHRGNPAAALRALDELQRQWPKPQLAPEATLIHIEALLKLGQLPQAKQLGSQFLTSQPDGPYAQRVRSLLNSSSTH